jgi:hypothetical protein
MRCFGTFILLCAVSLSACKRDSSSTAQASAAASSSADSPGDCGRTADKLNELSLAEARSIGREWSDAKAAKKKADFVVRCKEGQKDGSMTNAVLACVAKATELSEAQRCMRPK